MGEERSKAAFQESGQAAGLHFGRLVAGRTAIALETPGSVEDGIAVGPAKMSLAIVIHEEIAELAKRTVGVKGIAELRPMFVELGFIEANDAPKRPSNNIADIASRDPGVALGHLRYGKIVIHLPLVVGGGLGEIAKALLALLQLALPADERGLGRPEFRDILHRSLGEEKPAALVDEVLADLIEQAFAAVPPDDAVMHRMGPVGTPLQRGEGVGDPLAIIGMDVSLDIFPIADLQLAGRHAEDGFGPLRIDGGAAAPGGAARIRSPYPVADSRHPLELALLQAPALQLAGEGPAGCIEPTSIPLEQNE